MGSSERTKIVGWIIVGVIALTALSTFLSIIVIEAYSSADHGTSDTGEGIDLLEILAESSNALVTGIIAFGGGVLYVNAKKNGKGPNGG